VTVLASGDVRGFYEALGIELPGWAQREAPARCFAAPDAHNHGDRSPSTSVSVTNGAWCCHGCGARGGAYDAALAVGHTPRSAIELMIAHGLVEPGAGGDRQRVSGLAISPVTARPLKAQASVVPALSVTDTDVRRWQASLSHRPALLVRLSHERGWRYTEMRELEIGLDASQRLTIPIRAGSGELRGVLRYRPWPTHGSKMLAARGTRLGLVPHPTREPSSNVLLVEGPPDMIAARSHGLPAIAVPGTQAWRPEWAELLAGRSVTVIMDCDRPGRGAAHRIASDLTKIADTRLIDLDHRREDGYDLTQALLERRAHLIKSDLIPQPRSPQPTRRPSSERGAER
jgi:Toprim-like